jgi:hypothetical protein
LQGSFDFAVAHPLRFLQRMGIHECRAHGMLILSRRAALAPRGALQLGERRKAKAPRVSSDRAEGKSLFVRFDLPPAAKAAMICGYLRARDVVPLHIQKASQRLKPADFMSA